MAHEPGMSIEHDAINKTVTVHFRGERAVLPGRYETHAEAVRAGEEHCRRLGWKG